MKDEQVQSHRRSDEAADWLARLSTNKISNADLDAFWAWRRDPLNRAAYERMEDFNATARGLRDDPDMRAAVQEAMTRRPWWRSILAALSFPRGAYVAGALAAGIAAVLLIAPLRSGERHTTAIGEQVTVRLDDGSKIQLNTDSALRVRFSKSERRLVLERGQAFFDVAHDPARPFVVDAGKASVRALGTRFDVRRSDGEVEVTLAQGSVEVTPEHSGARTWTLSEGQKIRIDPNRSDVAPASTDLAVATAWTSGRMFFHDTPLAQAVAEVNRYNRKKIALGAGAPRDMKINGAFDAGDTEGFVAAAAEGLGLEVARKSDGVIELRVPRPPAA